eukprot:1398364-Amphidinium_carterae.1
MCTRDDANASRVRSVTQSTTHESNANLFDNETYKVGIRHGIVFPSKPTKHVRFASELRLGVEMCE